MLKSILNKRLLSTTNHLNKDPFKLPFDPSLSSTSQADDLNQEFYPKPIERVNESISIKKSRLLYQSRHRGTLESDLILSTFAQKYLSQMDTKELNDFDKLMDEPDWDIYYWSLNRKPLPARWENNPIIDKLKLHVKNEEKVSKRMPPVQAIKLN